MNRPPPTIPLFTVASPGADLASVYAGLRRQTWRGWRWIIEGVPDDPSPWKGDPRVVALNDASALWGKLAEGFFGWLPAGFSLRPATLEKWLWFLDRHPECLLVDGRTAESGETAQIRPGRFDGMGEGWVEAPFLAAARLAAEIAGPRGVADDVLWTQVLHAEPGALGWTVPEEAADAMRFASGILSPEAFAAREAYRRDPLSARVMAWERGQGKPISLDLGWRLEPVARSPASRRVLMVLPSVSIDGANSFNINVARTLAAAGHSVHVATIENEFNRCSPDYERLTPDVFHLSNLLDPYDRGGFLAALIASRGIDLVFTSETHLGKYWIPLLRARFPEVAFFDYCHVLHLDERPGTHPGQSAALLSQIDLAVASSDALRQWMKAQAGKSALVERLEVCHTGIDVSFWKKELCGMPDLKAALGIPSDRAVIVYPCRLAPQKNPMMVAEVLRRLVQEDGLDPHLLVVGDGPLRQPMTDFLAQHGLQGRVAFTGFVNAVQMREIYRISDIFLLPSEWEGISLALHEAMAMGIAPVTTDVGGQRELVNEDCGRLLRCGSGLAEACRTALRELLTDSALCRRLGEAAQRRVIEQFDAVQAGQRMLRLFEEARRLCKERPQAPWPEAAAQELVRLEISLQAVERKGRESSGRLIQQAQQLHQHALRQEQELKSARSEIERLRTALDKFQKRAAV